MKHFLILVFILVFIVTIRLLSFQGTYEVYDPEELEKLELNSAPIGVFLSSQAAELLPQPQAALLSGMVMGVKEDLPSDFKKALRDTSTIHIVVVSGQNLTLLSAFILGFASFVGRKKAILASLVISFGYAVITGLQVPVLRAFLMFAMVGLAQLANREIHSFKVLVITGLGMLAYNPSWLFSLSFQLSFLATIGVVVVAPELQKTVKLPDFIKTDLAATLAAQPLTLPIIAINFHQMSLVGVLVNALVLWTVPVVMIFGALALIFNLVVPVVAQIMVLIPYILLTYFVYMVEFFDQKWASVYVPKLGLAVWLGYGLILASLYWILARYNATREDTNVLSLDNVQTKN